MDVKFTLPPRNEAEARERVVRFLTTRGVNPTRAEEVWLERPFSLDMEPNADTRGPDRAYTLELWAENELHFRRILQTEAAPV